MDISNNKLHEFETTLREIRDAALSDTSLFTDREFRKTMIWLSYGFGALIAIFCILEDAVIAKSASASLPSIIIWSFIAVIALGALLK
jgi:hypothetical protein